MSEKNPKKIHVGEGILKPGVRPITVFVDESGEYWLCDSNVDPKTKDFRKAGCTSYSEIPMAEGG